MGVLARLVSSDAAGPALQNGSGGRAFMTYDPQG